jgi:hypothetical protein
MSDESCNAGKRENNFSRKSIPFMMRKGNKDSP